MEDYAGDLIRGAPAVLILGMQNEFLERGKPADQAWFKQVLYNIFPLINKAREMDIPLMFSQETHRDPRYFGYEGTGYRHRGFEKGYPVEGTPAWELAPGLQPLSPRDYVLRKSRYSCFLGTDLEYLLHLGGTGTLILAGIYSNLSVHYTYVDALQRGFSVRVAQECVAGTNQELHQGALNQMRFLSEDGVHPLSGILKALDVYQENLANRKQGGTGC